MTELFTVFVVSSLNAMDKLPMAEIPLTFAFGVEVWGLQFVLGHFGVGVMCRYAFIFIL